MKIAMISEHASPLAALGGVDAGGQNVHVAALSEALARRGHQVTVYTRRDATELPARVSVGPGFDVVHVDAGPPRHVPKDELLPFMGELADGVARDWDHRPPDVVHGHFWMSGLAALDAARRAGSGYRVPVIQTFHALGTVKRRHQGAEDTSPQERRWLEPGVGRSADRIIATCSDEVFELKAMGINTGKISIAPCGVDLDVFGPDGPVDAKPRSHRILSVGRLVPRKGVDLVIRALPHLRAAGFADVELLIVGGGGDSGTLHSDPEVRRLLGLAAELGVQDQVVMEGQVPRGDMPGIFRSADAVVCAPWYEPFGIVPLEAMACGVPVVAAAVGGLRDTVVDHGTGLHVPPRDPEAIASALAMLLGNPSLRAELGNAGQRRARARYSWDRVAAESEKAYKLAVAGAAAGAAGPAAIPLEGAAL
ncbi:glycosyl transferase group 1 [Pseudarthrobacter chlorophenolicus A6]|uniref:Glycosyl transferase group 1 n=1 Tax=Pseudarthrobacter chlorophenolicus (strain ATCC 700700 / DSM 12829 / CIP 107037 / JCM 12360 / KCTC 9906 / NCIMB 13794 / A6) TaxID=452863 RepID=B8HB83_PSECP|nr:glycosyltransferase [Pseudarthrobacter chlorophenolicus]ACL38568.1 glycosyl transferase group 1 [Pseudarthrobacter chlorophenolicus A6]SDQ46091.1 Glycosyltransferase involved in cell wall bisynthesis [Pseudarthrobacter chlorophenolicus]